MGVKVLLCTLSNIKEFGFFLFPVQLLLRVAFGFLLLHCLGEKTLHHSLSFIPKKSIAQFLII